MERMNRLCGKQPEKNRQSEMREPLEIDERFFTEEFQKHIQTIDFDNDKPENKKRVGNYRTIVHFYHRTQ